MIRTIKPADLIADPSLEPFVEAVSAACGIPLKQINRIYQEDTSIVVTYFDDPPRLTEDGGDVRKNTFAFTMTVESA